MKLENQSLKVRVGGGYLNIEDFVNQYSPVEQEKLERDLNQKQNLNSSRLLPQGPSVQRSSPSNLQSYK